MKMIKPEMGKTLQVLNGKKKKHGGTFTSLVISLFCTLLPAADWDWVKTFFKRRVYSAWYYWKS